MLVLPIRAGERIIIGDGPDAVVVCLTEIDSQDRAALGFLGPREVSIDRECVRMRKDRGEQRPPREGIEGIGGGQQP